MGCCGLLWVGVSLLTDTTVYFFCSYISFSLVLSLSLFLSAGQSFNPTDVEFEMYIAYGAMPVFMTWSGQPAIVMGTMLLMAGVCWCTYGGWNRDRDLQTGYSASGAAGDSMSRTVREFHEIKRNELETSILGGEKKGKGSNQMLLDSAEKYKSHQVNSGGGIHFEWVWPCNCKIYRPTTSADKKKTDSSASV